MVDSPRKEIVIRAVAAARWLNENTVYKVGPYKESEGVPDGCFSLQRPPLRSIHFMSPQVTIDLASDLGWIEEAITSPHPPRCFGSPKCQLDIYG